MAKVFKIEATIKTEKDLDRFVDFMEQSGLCFTGSWTDDVLRAFVMRYNESSCDSVDQEEVFCYLRHTTRSPNIAVSKLIDEDVQGIEDFEIKPEEVWALIVNDTYLGKTGREGFKP